MDKHARDLLLVEQEEAEREYTLIRAQLVDIGKKLAGLGNALMENPSFVVFSNAPSPHGSIPQHLVRQQAFEWNELSNTETIASLVQKLREIEGQLETLRYKLAGS